MIKILIAIWSPSGPQVDNHQCIENTQTGLKRSPFLSINSIITLDTIQYIVLIEIS